MTETVDNLRQDGVRIVRLRSEHLEVDVAPEVGGRIVGIRHLGSGESRRPSWVASFHADNDALAGRDGNRLAQVKRVFFWRYPPFHSPLVVAGC